MLSIKQIFRRPASLTPFHNQITPVRRSSLCPSSIFPAISQHKLARLWNILAKDIEGDTFVDGLSQSPSEPDDGSGTSPAKWATKRFEVATANELTAAAIDEMAPAFVHELVEAAREQAVA